MTSESATPSAPLRNLRLRRGEDKRIRAGHLWVFSNEIDVGKTPITAFEPGEQATLLDAAGKPLGIVYVNPRSLIAARVVSRDVRSGLDERLLATRLDQALALRKRIHDGPWGRLVFGESDRLPGLIVDRYGDVLVGQTTTAGMARWEATIAQLLRERTGATAMLWRNDLAVRELEGLPREIRPAFGEIPERLVLEEAGSRFSIATHVAQKTGWFYDQRANRERLSRYVAGARCADLFCYGGGWGIRAAALGAREVTCVDAGEQAIADVERNVADSGLADRIRVVRSDAFRFLEQALDDGERYDLIVLDPPAFAKRRKDVKPALKAYRRLNELALRLLDREGLLISCTCSSHIREEVFFDVIHQAARHVDRQLQLLERLQQSPDHPVHPAIPETRYLKGAIYRVTRTC